MRYNTTVRKEFLQADTTKLKQCSATATKSEARKCERSKKQNIHDLSSSVQIFNKSALGLWSDAYSLCTLRIHSKTRTSSVFIEMQRKATSDSDNYQFITLLMITFSGFTRLLSTPLTSSFLYTTLAMSTRNIKAAQFPGDPLWLDQWKAGTGEANIGRRQATVNPKFTLYSSWFCPFAQRAWIVAEETGADYKWVEVNPYEADPNKPGGYTKLSLSLEEKRKLHPGFVEASPRGLVPAIQHDHIHIWESLPVAEYLDSVFGNGCLVPNDPQQKALMQIWTAHCTDRIQKEYYRALMAQSKELRTRALEQYYEECRVFSRSMKSTGPYFFGDYFSLVDVALAPFWQRMLWVGGHYFNLKFPEEPEFARLDKWWKATKERPSIKETFVCKERLISSYSDYHQNIATSDFAKSMK